MVSFFKQSWYFPDNEGTVRTIERIDVELLAKLRSSESFTMRKIKMSKVGYILEIYNNPKNKPQFFKLKM